MSRFNPKKKDTSAPDTINLAGGEAYSQSAELELISVLLTSWGTNDFYRSAADTFKRLRELIATCDKEFVAKAAVYARREFGMRSITHVVAAELAKHIGGQVWAKDFYNAIVYRPDDMAEIISYYFANCAKPNAASKRNRVTIPNAMKGGFAMAFGKFDAYGFAKYKGEGKELSLVDVANIVHPSPSGKNGVVKVTGAEYVNALPNDKKQAAGRIFRKGQKQECEITALEALMLGLLKPAETWETALTQAGQTADTAEDKAELKKDAWVKLIRGKKMKYLGLLRNLRNIVEQAPEVVDEACDMLTDVHDIKKSLVFPFQYAMAYEQIQMLNSAVARKVMKALNAAVDISCCNVPLFEGETLVVLDVSGSMQQPCNDKTKNTPAKIGALFAAVLVKRNDCDFMTFGTDAQYVNWNSEDSTLTLAQSIQFTPQYTFFKKIFERANKKYDRIIILSDEQGYSERNPNNPIAAFNNYKRATGANPYIYSFDLKNYGTMQFAESKVLALAGVSDKVFDIMELCEQEPKALIKMVKEYSFAPKVAAMTTVMVGSKGTGKSYAATEKGLKAFAKNTAAKKSAKRK